MPKPKNQKHDYEQMPEDYIDFDENGTLIDEEYDESSDVLDQEVESLDELQEDEEYKEEDGYGGGVEGIYNWDEWN
tara:strand:- start:2632 stop:2859 length:228 start_codon:yes stop_codon:yes gene_type:complete